ncbi:MAG: transketolase C-terminal domain-containing protein [Anaerolineaceae bacterium]|jgi:transketolase|nr:transketolase C-terminal domain-containing protein [Anaerolineaceae bacterium]
MTQYDSTGNNLAPREVIGETLVELGEKDSKLLVIDCDLGLSTRLVPFEKRFPERFIQLGSQEQNAIGVATGLSYAGYHPVFVCFTMFSIGLPWTQIRMAAYSKVPFTIIGTHPGFDIGPDGGTHQMMEDLALARSIPGLDVLCPADSVEVKSAMTNYIGSDRLVYIRVGRQPVPAWHTESVDFVAGKGVFWKDDGRDVVLIADGSMSFNALEAAKLLDQRGLKTAVVNIRSLKPLDEDLIRKLAIESKLLVSVENHSILGGLGGAIAEIAAEEGGRLYRVGSPDCFGESASADQLRHKHKMDVEGILERLEAPIQRWVDKSI